MPFKHNAARRHCTPQDHYRVMNWPGYEAGLRKRGDLIWRLNAAVLSSWAAPKPSGRGGQPRFFGLAVEFVPTLQPVFHLAQCQAEAFSSSVLRMFGLALFIPDHSTLSRRA